jgi:hypothetical protein
VADDEHAAELAKLRRQVDRAYAACLRLFDMALTYENVDADVRRRIRNRLVYGDPDGDVSAMMTLDDCGRPIPPELNAKQSHDTFTCPDCGMTSHNPHDAEHNYCGNCHQFYNAIKGAP